MAATIPKIKIYGTPLLPIFECHELFYWLRQKQTKMKSPQETSSRDSNFRKSWQKGATAIWVFRSSAPLASGRRAEKLMKRQMARSVVVSLWDVTESLYIEISRSDGPQKGLAHVDLTHLKSYWVIQIISIAVLVHF